MKTIYFFSNKLNQGSTILRAYQIKQHLQKIIPNKIVVTKPLYVKNAIIIWIGPFRHKYKLHPSNRHILDIVDKYISFKFLCEKTLKLYDGIIVNSTWMGKYFKQNLNYPKLIHVIHHHWDPRFKNTQTDCPNLNFGYIGSIEERNVSQNFRHFRQISKKIPIEFYDTEIGKLVTDKVHKKLDFPIKYSNNNIPKKVTFNCDISIRDKNSNLFNFKTSAKLATAAALGHNIITTYDKAVQDILPDNYPFILRDLSVEEIINFFQKVIDDYQGDKILWEKGLKMMKEVKRKLSIREIVLKYKNLIKDYL